MRAAPAALVNWLAADYEVVVADLYTFALASGLTLRRSGFTTALQVPASAFADPRSVNYGHGWNFALGPKFGRSKISVKIGVEPSSLDVEIIPDPNSDLIGTFTWQQAIRVGLFDKAVIELDRYFMQPGSLAPLGAITWFYGWVSETEFGRSKIAMKVSDGLVLLKQQQMPRRLFSSNCTHVFGDAMCGYDRVAGKNALGVATGLGAENVTAAAGSTQAAIVTGFTPSALTAYDNGTITATSGANAGQKRTIKQLVGGVAYMLQAWFFPVAAGDGFQMLPGCDHTLATCVNAFNNGAPSGGRYGGFPYIPPPELAV